MKRRQRYARWQTHLMPVTWFAHQVPVLGMKLARPRWFDATALCIGSMTPDMMYSFSAYLEIDPHRAPEAFVFGVPFATVVAIVVRYVLAPVGPASLPDAGRLRLRSYAVIARRRPNIAITVVGAALGLGSHIVIDWFTHPGWQGSRWLGYENLSVTVFGFTESMAQMLQLIGHSFGSLFGVMLLALIGRRRLLDDWYGPDQVAAARAWRPTTVQQLFFWVVLVAGFVLGAFWGSGAERIELIERTFVGAMVGAVFAAVVIRLGARGPDRTARRGPEQARPAASSAR